MHPKYKSTPATNSCSRSKFHKERVLIHTRTFLVGGIMTSLMYIFYPWTSVRASSTNLFLSSSV